MGLFDMCSSLVTFAEAYLVKSERYFLREKFGRNERFVWFTDGPCAARLKQRDGRRRRAVQTTLTPSRRTISGA